MYHVGMLTLKSEATKLERQEIISGLSALVNAIPGLKRVLTGADMGIVQGNADLVFLLEFESQEAWEFYGDNPVHKKLIAEKIAPALESKLFVQVDALTETLPSA